MGDAVRRRRLSREDVAYVKWLTRGPSPTTEWERDLHLSRVFRCSDVTIKNIRLGYTHTCVAAARPRWAKSE